MKRTEQQNQLGANRATSASQAIGGFMSCSSSISIAFIIANYSDRKVWKDVCGYTLSDGTRLVETALGDGFRIYRESMGVPLYVPFS
jgi:hypothetical protein